jgi:hypothetical protein
MTSLLLIFETGVVLANFILCFHISLGSWQQDSWVILCRAANVFSCAYLVNLVRPAHRKIPSKHQKALWYSGKESISTSHWLYRVKLISSANERNCFFPLAFSLLWRLSFFPLCEHEQDFEGQWPLPLLCNQFMIFQKDMDRPYSLQLQQ